MHILLFALTLVGATLKPQIHQSPQIQQGQKNVDSAKTDDFSINYYKL